MRVCVCVMHCAHWRSTFGELRQQLTAAAGPAVRSARLLPARAPPPLPPPRGLGAAAVPTSAGAPRARPAPARWERAPPCHSSWRRRRRLAPPHSGTPSTLTRPVTQVSDPLSRRYRDAGDDLRRASDLHTASSKGRRCVHTTAACRNPPASAPPCPSLPRRPLDPATHFRAHAISEPERTSLACAPLPRTTQAWRPCPLSRRRCARSRPKPAVRHAQPRPPPNRSEVARALARFPYHSLPIPRAGAPSTFNFARAFLVCVPDSDGLPTRARGMRHGALLRRALHGHRGRPTRRLRWPLQHSSRRAPPSLARARPLAPTVASRHAGERGHPHQRPASAHPVSRHRLDQAPPTARLRDPPARARAGCARAVRVQSLRPSRGPHKALSWTHHRCAQGQRDRGAVAPQGRGAVAPQRRGGAPQGRADVAHHGREDAPRQGRNAIACRGRSFGHSW